MTLQIKISRRQAPGAAATLPLAAALGTGAADAAAPALGPATPKYSRFTMGAFEVTTLLAASAPMENPQSIFGQNVSAEEFAAVSQSNFLPADMVQFFFTPTVVNTGSELVLFDTGLSAQGTVGALEQAGYSADQVDTVVITHMHGDHIG
ncbi:MAG: MBL fold metallo-hydrolase, partial [Halocynthiibacter sp.]